MRKIHEISITEAYEKGGQSKSFVMPADCAQICGIFAWANFKGVASPPLLTGFTAGHVSVLFDNKNENTVHLYPVAAYNENGIIVSGKKYSRIKNLISVNTDIERPTTFTVVFVDSAIMQPYINDDPVAYGDYDPDIHVAIEYNTK